jgi:poly(3-hydroxybutyrate) depolymerase
MKRDSAAPTHDKSRRFMRGKIVRRTLAGDPSLQFHLYVPHSLPADAPILVAVHGISLNSREYARAFAPLAEERGVIVVAPRFESPAFRDYQRLGRSHLGERADLALDRLVDRVRQRTGTCGERIHLFGQSGGAQFAQRYAFAHPERVASVVVASAGWYAFPDLKRSYPYGIRRNPRLPGVRFRLDRLLPVPMLVVVGDGDTRRNGDALRRSPRLDRQQGTTRLERAVRFVDEMKAAAREHGVVPAQELLILASSDHSFAHGMGQGGLAELACNFLFDRENSSASAQRTKRLALATAGETK